MRLLLHVTVGRTNNAVHRGSRACSGLGVEQSNRIPVGSLVPFPWCELQRSVAERHSTTPLRFVLCCTASVVNELCKFPDPGSVCLRSQLYRVIVGRRLLVPSLPWEVGARQRHARCTQCSTDEPRTHQRPFLLGRQLILVEGGACQSRWLSVVYPFKLRGARGAEGGGGGGVVGRIDRLHDCYTSPLACSTTFAKHLVRRAGALHTSTSFRRRLAEGSQGCHSN